jgi:penicillin amidase
VVTRHGPLITNLLPEAERSALPPLALRWVGHEAGASLRAVLRCNQATTIDAFEAALEEWDVASQNFVFADVRGNIGWRLAGRIPVRANHVGATPAPGWTGDHEWTGYIPFAELPSLRNPPTGIIVSANNKPVGDEYPYFLGLEFNPGWRAARITELLNERERFSVRDMEEIQLDTMSHFAAEMTRWLTLNNSDDPWEKVSIQALRKWDFRMEVDSMPALVFHYTVLHLLEMVFGDKLGRVRDAYLGGSVTPLFTFSSHIDRAELKLLELLESDESSVWYMEARTGRRRTRDELLQEALSKAVSDLREGVSDSTLKWAWGRSHQVAYVHPLGSVRFLRNAFNRGPIPVGGDHNTIFQTRSTPKLPLGMVQVIPSYRQIIEVGAWERMQSVTATGQSGHPPLATYDDQMVMWREGVYHVTPWRREAVEKAAVQRQQLRPAE